MIRINKYHLTFFFLLWVSFQSVLQAQSVAGYSSSELSAYEARAKDQVKFLEYLFNTLGDANTNARDKDVIIRESYKKIFRDEEVQIEDDLTADRNVITNKDVTAYLKDIDFFFKNAHFDFEIQSVEPFERENGQLSLKIELNRTLKATGLEGEDILNTKKRYIETNLFEQDDELLIASIYTTKVSRDEALKEWWNNLSYGWQEVFKEKLSITSDSLALDQLYTVVAIDSLNLSDQPLISTLDPLSMLVDLQKLNLSNTQIQNINALSSLTELVSLDLSNTAISDLSYLRYAEKMEKLNLSFTQVRDLSALENLGKLKVLSLKGTDMTDFATLANFQQLEELDMSETFFNELEHVKGLQELNTLNIARTNVSALPDSLCPGSLQNLDITFTTVSDLRPLSNHQQLKTLQMSNTQVNDLTPLQGLESLEKVYADNTFVTESEAQDFTNANPSVLIIINSEALSAWWASLDPNWKQAFKNYMPGYSGSIPPKEQLTRLLSIDSLAVSASGIRELFPLKKFSRLRYLDISQNSLRELRPLRGLSGLNYLDASGNTITDISPLLSLKKLQYLNLADNEVSEESFQQLSLLRSLERLNVNGMDIKRMAVAQFLEQINNKCIVRYNDVQTQSWWNSLDNKWKQILRVQLSIGNSPDSWELHRLLALPRIVIVDEGIASLDPLAPFIQLQSLYLERVGLQNLSSLNSIQTLTELSIIETPVTDISPVSTIKSLKSLTLDFSAVEDLRPLESLENLEELSVAGTKVDKLKGLENLYMLRFLDVSSTQVKKLKRLDIINNLEQVVCYNTRINDRRLEKFKEEHPDCAVRWY